jgi:hypothetical protein
MVLERLKTEINTYVTKVHCHSDSTHHFFRNACTKSGSLRFSKFSRCWLILSVYILMSFDFPFGRQWGQIKILCLYWIAFLNDKTMTYKTIVLNNVLVWSMWMLMNAGLIWFTMYFLRLLSNGKGNKTIPNRTWTNSNNDPQNTTQTTKYCYCRWV